LTTEAAPGVAPVSKFAVRAPVGVDPLKRLKVLAVPMAAAPMTFTVAPAVTTLARETVVDPEPLAITTLLDPADEEPNVIAPL
jgi:hypothetical protein